MNRDAIRKAMLYVCPLYTYWRPSAPPQNVDCRIAFEAYPLQVERRIAEGHFDRFDGHGVPVRRSRHDGDDRYQITTMCAYALGSWNLHLIRNDSRWTEALLTVSRKLLELLDKSGDGLITGSHETSNFPSAMSQGEAISVLVRAWVLTGETRYLRGAECASMPFSRSIDERGVAEHWKEAGGIWYEEIAIRPLRHILNGMIYALWGLRDLHKAAEHEGARRLFEDGVGSVVNAIMRFDTGWWSLYHAQEDNPSQRIASIMYHNLHVAQLRILYQQTGRSELLSVAKRWEQYAVSPILRFWAAIYLLSAKSSAFRI
jgi:heparosan-N-sulfate-glucuronate 5-epimerase